MFLYYTLACSATVIRCSQNILSRLKTGKQCTLVYSIIHLEMDELSYGNLCFLDSSYVRQARRYQWGKQRDNQYNGQQID